MGTEKKVSRKRLYDAMMPVLDVMSENIGAEEIVIPMQEEPAMVEAIADYLRDSLQATIAIEAERLVVTW